MQHIYFVRHGQTQNNLEWRMNTWDDNDPLTQHGKQQAKQAWEQWKKAWIYFDIIISSSLARAKETAQIIAGEIWYNGKIIIDNRLREQDGWIFKWKLRDEIKQKYWTHSDAEFRKIFKNKKYNKIEDVTEFDQRVSDSLSDIRMQYPEKNILIVGHSGTSRPILRNLNNMWFNEAHYEMKGAKNAEIIKII